MTLQCRQQQIDDNVSDADVAFVRSNGNGPLEFGASACRNPAPESPACVNSENLTVSNHRTDSPASRRPDVVENGPSRLRSASAWERVPVRRNARRSLEAMGDEPDVACGAGWVYAWLTTTQE